MTRAGGIAALLTALGSLPAAAQFATGAFPLDAPDAPLVSLCTVECDAQASGSPVTVTLRGALSQVDVSRFTPSPRLGAAETGTIGAAASAYGFDFSGAFHQSGTGVEDRLSFGAGFARGALRFGGGLSFGLGREEDATTARTAAGLGLGVSLAPGLSLDGGVAFSEKAASAERETDVEAGVRMRFDF